MFFFLFFVYAGGYGTWAIGCAICCIIIASTPIGALLSWTWTKKKNSLNPDRYVLLGALYWMSGLMPWFYFMLRVNNLNIPYKTMNTVYVILFAAWFMGPIVGGFLSASDLPDTNESIGDWIFIHPIASFIAFIISVVCVLAENKPPVNIESIDLYRIIPSALGTLSMLSFLYLFLAV